MTNKSSETLVTIILYLRCAVLTHVLTKFEEIIINPSQTTLLSSISFSPNVSEPPPHFVINIFKNQLENLARFEASLPSSPSDSLPIISETRTHLLVSNPPGRSLCRTIRCLALPPPGEINTYSNQHIVPYPSPHAQWLCSTTMGSTRLE